MKLVNIEGVELNIDVDCLLGRVYVNEKQYEVAKPTKLLGFRHYRKKLADRTLKLRDSLVYSYIKYGFKELN